MNGGMNHIFVTMEWPQSGLCSSIVLSVFLKEKVFTFTQKWVSNPKNRFLPFWTITPKIKPIKSHGVLFWSFLIDWKLICRTLEKFQFVRFWNWWVERNKFCTVGARLKPGKGNLVPSKLWVGLVWCVVLFTFCSLVFGFVLIEVRRIIFQFWLD